MNRFLTEHEIAAFNAYAETTQNTTPYSNFLRDWWLPGNQEIAQNLLQGKTILKKRISIKISPQQQERFLDNFYDTHHTFKDWFWEKFYMQSNDWEVEDGTEINSVSTVCWSIFCGPSLLSNTFKYLYNENLKGTFVLKNTATNKKMKISLGETKLGKIFTFILKQINDEELNKLYEEFRVDLSKIIQQKAFTGTLCLSVHPLDFATMSDNLENWSSCMSWESNGCYRAGTLEMLASPIVLVAYIEHENKMLTFAGYEWNSKLWRSLFIVNDQFITEVKSYPFYNENISKAALEWIAELSGPNFTNSPLLIASGCELDSDEHSAIFHTKDDSIILPRIYFLTNKMYNDMCLQKQHLAIAGQNFLQEKEEYDIVTIEYGSKAPCLECGNDIEMGGTLLCKDHGQYTHCAHCGEVLDTNHSDIYYSQDGSPYCYECWNEISSLCHWCEDYVEEDILQTVSFKDTNNGITLHSDICCHCTASMRRRQILKDDDNTVDIEYMSRYDFVALFENDLDTMFTREELNNYLDTLPFEKALKN